VTDEAESVEPLPDVDLSQFRPAPQRLGKDPATRFDLEEAPEDVVAEDAPVSPTEEALPPGDDAERWARPRE